MDRNNRSILNGSGGRIRTSDLRVMSPASYQTAPPRVTNNNYIEIYQNKIFLTIHFFLNDILKGIPFKSKSTLKLFSKYFL